MTTDVPSVVQQMFAQLQGQPVSAMVLLTDGRSTEATLRTIATAAAQQRHTPIYVVPTGQVEDPLNLRIASVEVPENTFVKDPVAVKVKVQVTGVDKPTPMTLVLVRKNATGGDTELKRQTIQAQPGKKDYDIELNFKPEKIAGNEKFERYDLEVRAEAIGDELTLKDNVAAAQTTVMDATIAALYIDGYPRWEFRYLKNELIREKTIRVSTLLLSADESFAQEGSVEKTPEGEKSWAITRFPENAEELNRYDILLIGDVDPQYFSPAQQKLIVEWVKAGGGIGWLAGPQYTPDAYKDTPMEPLLPVIPDDPNRPTLTRAENEPFNLQLTVDGKATNLFRFFDTPEENLKQVAENPPLYWYRPVVGLKPVSTVLAVHPNKTQGGTPVPLLVTSQYARGRTFYSAIADTWRWRRYKGEPLYQSYWLQVCRLLYRDKAMGQSKRIELTTDAKAVEVGRVLTLRAEVRDVTLAPALPATIPLQLTDDMGRPMEPVNLVRVEGSEGRYRGTLRPTVYGRLRAQVAPGVLPVDVQPLEVDVTPPSREWENTLVDLPAMEFLAKQTEGKVIPLSGVEELARLIPDRSQLSLVSLSEELWNKWIAVALVVALLTAEWFVRKAAGLI